MKSYPTKFKSFLWKIVVMGTLQKLQNSIQTLIIFWPVYPIHTNSLFWVIFVELLFCHFPPPNTSIRDKDSKIWLIFHLNILVFQTNGKQPYSFPVLSRFCNGLLINPTVWRIWQNSNKNKCRRIQNGLLGNHAVFLTREVWTREHGNVRFHISCAWISCLSRPMEAIYRRKTCR